MLCGKVRDDARLNRRRHGLVVGQRRGVCQQLAHSIVVGAEVRICGRVGQDGAQDEGVELPALHILSKRGSRESACRGASRQRPLM